MSLCCKQGRQNTSVPQNNNPANDGKRKGCVPVQGAATQSLFHLLTSWVGPPRENRKNNLLGHSHALTVLSNQVCHSLRFPIIITALVWMTSLFKCYLQYTAVWICSFMSLSLACVIVFSLFPDCFLPETFFFSSDQMNEQIMVSAWRQLCAVKAINAQIITAAHPALEQTLVYEHVRPTFGIVTGDYHACKDSNYNTSQVSSLAYYFLARLTWK